MLIKLRKAQNTAEYAIVLGLVVGAVVAMQVFVKRNLQARVKTVTDFQETTASDYGLDYSYQYEPYYLESNFTVTRDSSGEGLVTKDSATRGTSDNVERTSGFQSYGYNRSSGYILNDSVTP